LYKPAAGKNQAREGKKPGYFRKAGIALFGLSWEKISL
jgi:hypothetical protein